MAHTILVIEDDAEIRQTLVDILGDEGFYVLSAENGEEGLKVLETAEVLPCLIILDWMMPVMDGESFRKEQLKFKKYSSIPTVLFSANGKISQQTFESDYDEYIRKPIDLEQLFEITQKYCS